MNFISWIQANYMLVISVFVGLFNLIALFFKKPVKVEKSLSTLLNEKLVIWINEAELTGFPGGEKKLYVVKKAVDFLSIALGWNEADTKAVWYDLIVNSIELLLSTPQKKGQ